MRIIKILLIGIIAFALVIAGTIFLTRSFLRAKIESLLIEKIEQATRTEIDIASVTYLPPAGLILSNINISSKDLPSQSNIFIKKLHVKVNPTRLMRKKEVAALFKVEGLEKDNINVRGSVFIESNPFKNIRNPLEDFSVKTIDISGLDFSSPFLSFKNLDGEISVTEKLISSSKITFDYSGGLHTLSFNLKNLKAEPSMNAKIEGPDIQATIALLKTEEIIKIKSSKILLFDSSLEYEGEISDFKNPSLLLYASLKLKTKDLRNINKKLCDFCDKIKIGGTFYSEIYFKGRLSDPSKWEIGMKNHSPRLKLWNYRFHDLSFDLKMENELISVPLLTAYPYDGILNSTVEIDISRRDMPYAIGLRLKDIDIHGVVKHSNLKKKKIYGLVDSEIVLQGNGSDPRSITGKGYVHISQANLGPMPILSPLLGNLYGFTKNMLPGLQGVEINEGGFDFVIRDERIMTENLTLSGDVLNIYARGYIDFDTNLNFDVENEFKEAEEGAEDWRGSIVELIAGFGKFIGNARLTGTLSKPKWKFDYFGGGKSPAGGNLQNVLKDLF